MTDAELAALEAAARAATHPGPPSDVDAVWIDGACFVSVVADAECGRADDAYYRCHNMKATPRLRMRTSYRAFLETAHPSAILALIQRVREAEGRALRIRWGADSFGKADRALFIGNICAGHILDDFRRTKEGKPAWRAWIMRKDDDGEDLGWLDTEAAARAALEAAVREAMGHD